LQKVVIDFKGIYYVLVDILSEKKSHKSAQLVLDSREKYLHTFEGGGSDLLRNLFLPISA